MKSKNYKILSLILAILLVISLSYIFINKINENKTSEAKITYELKQENEKDILTFNYNTKYIKQINYVLEYTNDEGKIICEAFYPFIFENKKSNTGKFEIYSHKNFDKTTDLNFCLTNTKNKIITGQDNNIQTHNIDTLSNYTIIDEAAFTQLGLHHFKIFFKHNDGTYPDFSLSLYFL